MAQVQLSLAARNLRSSEVREFIKYACQPGMISMAGGVPAPDFFDVEGIRQATERAWSRADVTLQYGPTEGQSTLRAHLVADLQARGVSPRGHSLNITTGSQQGLDLVCRALLDKQDTVVVERPTYLAALQTLDLCGAIVRSVERDSDGPRIDELDGLASLRPKMLYLLPTFNNPTGHTTTLERRKLLLRWATENHVFVLEDNPYGELFWQCEPPPPLVALTREVPGSDAWCGYIGTLSKTLAPGLRVGWTLLPERLSEAVARIKQASDLHTSSFAQEVAYEYLLSGRMEAHLAKLRHEYAYRARTLLGALHASFGQAISVKAPEGGMFAWAEFLDGTNTRELLPHCLRRKVAFVPGDVFYPDMPNYSTMRLSFSNSPAPALEEGVRRLRAAHDELRSNSFAGPHERMLATNH